ncbi:MAG: hypothetical protein RLZZ210_1208 [Pseudomonadota bacterium]
MKLYSISELSNLPDAYFIPKKLPFKSLHNGKLKALTQSNNSKYSHWGNEYEHILLSIDNHSYDYKTNINCILAHRIKIKLKNLAGQELITSAKVMDIQGNQPNEYYRVIKLNLSKLHASNRNQDDKLSLIQCIRDKNGARDLSNLIGVKAHGCSQSSFSKSNYNSDSDIVDSSSALDLPQTFSVCFSVPYGYNLLMNTYQPHSVIDANDLDICYSLQKQSNKLEIKYFHEYENKFSDDDYIQFAGITDDLKYKNNIRFQSLFNNKSLHNEYVYDSYSLAYQACYQKVGLIQLSKKYSGSNSIGLNKIFSYLNSLQNFINVRSLIVNSCLYDKNIDYKLPTKKIDNLHTYQSPNYAKRLEYILSKMKDFSQSHLDTKPYSLNVKDITKAMVNPIKQINLVA